MHISTFGRAILLAAAAFGQSGPASAQETGFANTEQIDRLVEGFTGNPIGTTGGARQRVDRRLRLRACSGPLALDWYGAPGKTVQVECTGHGGWRIYVNLLRAPTQEQAGPAVKRGDMITVLIKGRGFTVQKQGEAKEAGSIGDWIEIRTGKDAPSIRARIQRPGLAVITSG